jgi:hypothetical protein
VTVTITSVTAETPTVTITSNVTVAILTVTVTDKVTGIDMRVAAVEVVEEVKDHLENGNNRLCSCHNSFMIWNQNTR